MRLKRLRVVREFLKIIPVGFTVTKQHMHQRTGQCAVGAGPHTEEKIGLFRRCVVVSVNNDDFCTPLAPRLERMGHDIDLGTRCVGAPEDDEIGLAHFSGIHTGQLTGTGDKAIERQCGADRGIKA